MAKAAARTEIKNRDTLLERIAMINPSAARKVGPVLLPYHASMEDHNGFYVLDPEQPVGVYRCQGFWWTKDLSTEAAKGRPDANISLYNTLPTAFPRKLAPTSVGIDGLARTLATHL